MALPQTFDPTVPADTDSPAQGAALLRDHIQKFIDVFGIPPSPSSLTAPIMTVNTDGSWAPPMRLTNKTGAGVIAGDVVALDIVNAGAVTLGDTAGSLKRFVVAQETIANDATGLWTGVGVTSVHTQGPITLGHYVKKSATTLKVEDTGTVQGDTTIPPTGALGLALSADTAGAALVAWWGAVAGGGGDLGANATVGDLRIEEATLPDATGTINNPAEIVREVSTAGQTTNTPKVTRTYARFDATTDEHLFWSLMVPSNYFSGGSIRLKWKSVTVNTNACVWKAGVAFTVDESSVDSAVAFVAANTVTSTVAGTIGQTKEASITLTMTGAVANRWMTIFIGRDADNAADTLVGDAWLVAARFEYVGTS